MADKSQTINIVYKFNTVEIEKANAALNKANTATNKLQQDASKMGQSGAGSAMDWTKSIAGLEAQMQRLSFRAKNAVNPAEAKKYGDQWAAVKKQLDDATKSAFSLGKATNDANKGINNMTLSFKNLSSVVGVGLLAGLLRETVDLTLSLSTLQGQVEGVERGFNRAFINPTQVLSEVREATQGTITDFDLMKRTLQATNLGVSVEHLGTLFEFAAARAQQTGESVDYLVDSIVRGIGRKSPLVLDNLGISVTALKEKFDGASIASKTVGEATEGVAEIAREQLEKMGGFVKTAETEVKQLGVSWENLRISLSKKIEASGLIGFFTDAANGLNALVKGGEELEKERSKQLAGERLAAIMRNEIFKDRKKNQQEQLSLITEEMMEVQRMIRLRENEIDAFEKSKEAAEKNIRTDEFGNIVAQESITWREKAIEGLKRDKKAYEELLPLMKNALRIMQSEMELNENNLKSLEKLREERDKMVQQFENIEDKDVTTLLDRQDLLKKAEDIKSINREIKALEDLLKEPKQLKIKLAPEFEDELKKLAHKFIEEGGTFKGVDPLRIFSDGTNPNATETIDEKWFTDFEQQLDPFEDAVLAGLSNTAEKGVSEFWTRFRLAFKRQSVTDKDLELQDAIVSAELTGITILEDQLTSLAHVEEEQFQARIRRTKEFYDHQVMLAGNNEKAKDLLRMLEDKKISKLRREQFIAEQKAARQSALINGAAAIVKTFATVGWPAGAVLAVAQAAATASQIAIIERQQPRFAKGVINLKGPGTGTSDSIPARLSKGESVMTSWETKNSGGILKEIRARKLDDRVLKNLREGRQPVPVGMTDEGIIRAIKENRPPDIIEQSGIVYKATKKSDDYINKQRAKSVRI
jgi:hypothetical protein